jgi:nucleoside-diphosphate-sugar epimerase
MAPSIQGAKILVTGASGKVALPILRSLASDNTVHGLARMRTRDAEELVRSTGAVPLAFDLASGSFADLDEDYDIVLNFAVRRSTDDDFERELAVGAEATGLLMQRCCLDGRFLHCSSTAVYRPPGDHAVRESDPLGDHHGSQLPTYSIGKIVAEGVARSSARTLGIPTVIVRLSVPYGPGWGWPVSHLAAIADGQPVTLHPADPMWFNPIHESDLVAQLPALLASAAVPATIVNWAGDEPVRLRDWCELMGASVGIRPTFVQSEAAFRGVRVDNTRRRAITGPSQIAWRDGFNEMIASWLEKKSAKKAIRNDD